MHNHAKPIFDLINKTFYSGIQLDTQPLSPTIDILDVTINDPDGTYEVKYLDRSEVEREISIEYAEIDALCNMEWLMDVVKYGRDVIFESYDKYVLRDIIKEFLTNHKTN